MKRLLLLALLCAGCSNPLAPAPMTLGQAFESYDWQHGTEEDFWQTYPQFRAEYDAAVEAQL